MQRGHDLRAFADRRGNTPCAKFRASPNRRIRSISEGSRSGTIWSRRRSRIDCDDEAMINCP